MRSIFTVETDALQWSPGMELHTGDDRVARIAWRRMLTDGLIETADGQWDFAVRGIFFPKVRVMPIVPDILALPSPEGDPLPPEWASRVWKGSRNLLWVWTLITPHARTLRWHRAGLGALAWVCTAADGDPMATTTLESQAPRVVTSTAAARVQVYPAAWDVPELAAVLSLGWVFTLWELSGKGGE
jgi:hypothetical protein